MSSMILPSGRPSFVLFVKGGHSMAPEPEPGHFRVEGATLFRYSSYDTPFWARNNRSAGRWNYAREAATQYLSADPDTAWAELIRYEGLRDENGVALVRMQIWAVSLEQGNLADYGTFEKAEAAGFSPAALIDDDWTECQREAERLRALGYAGVVAPSAALPFALNVTLFGPRVRTSWGRATRLASALPACVVAVGSPPVGLVSRVRHYGAPHEGYDHYIESLAEQAREDQLWNPAEREPEIRDSADFPPRIRFLEEQQSDDEEDN